MSEPIKPVEPKFSALSIPPVLETIEKKQVEDSLVEVSDGNKNQSPTWTIVTNHNPTELPRIIEIDSKVKELTADIDETAKEFFQLDQKSSVTKQPNGVFSPPRLTSLKIQNEVILNQGRTLVRLNFSGWGRLTAKARLEQKCLTYTAYFFSTGLHELVLMVPVGSEFTVCIRNLFGMTEQVLKIISTTSILPVSPKAPTVFNTRMSSLMLPIFSISKPLKLKPSDLRIIHTWRDRLPPFSAQLKSVLKSEFKKTKVLHDVLNLRQQYCRERMRSNYANLNVPQINTLLMQDDIKKWIDQVHHGTDISKPT